MKSRFTRSDGRSAPSSDSVVLIHLWPRTVPLRPLGSKLLHNFPETIQPFFSHMIIVPIHLSRSMSNHSHRHMLLKMIIEVGVGKMPKRMKCQSTLPSLIFQNPDTSQGPIQMLVDGLMVNWSSSIREREDVSGRIHPLAVCQQSPDLLGNRHNPGFRSFFWNEPISPIPAVLHIDLKTLQIHILRLTEVPKSPRIANRKLPPAKTWCSRTVSRPTGHDMLHL